MRTVARRRRRMSDSEYLSLKKLFRRVVMLTHGAAVFFEGKREHWQGKCAKCLRIKWLQVCHIEPVGRFPAMEFDLGNVFCACAYPCHLGWWHKGGHEPEEWIKARLGADARERLAFRARTTSRPDHGAIRVMLTAELKRLAPGFAWPN